jgi:hypothetical protein
LSIYGFGIVFISLIIATTEIYMSMLATLPLVTEIMLWEHYWDAENGMTIPTMAAKLDYRGRATGVAHVFVKVPMFLGMFLFPALFDAIGKANAMLFTVSFSLIGLLAAIFLLPEVYGCTEK